MSLFEVSTRYILRQAYSIAWSETQKALVSNVV